MTRGVPRMSLTMNRKRFFAFLTLMPSAFSIGQCDSNGVCTVKVRTA